MVLNIHRCERGVYTCRCMNVNKSLKR